MFRFQSLTAKYVFVSALLLLFFGLYSLAGFYFTNSMEGDARKINIAGRERMLVYRIASHLHFITSNAASADREKHARGAERAMDEYEEALDGLKRGSEKLGLEPLHAGDARSMAQLKALIDLWLRTQRPLLRSILRQPAQEGGRTCAACHAAIRDNLGEIETLVKHVQEHHDRELRDFNRYRIVALVFLAAVVTGVFLYAKKSLIRPAQRLKAAAEDIERGAFDVSVDVRTRDEIGALGKAFNSMARRLKSLFAEKEEHLHELNILNEIAIAASRTLELDDMLGRVMDAILTLAPLARVKKGAVFLYDQDAGALRLAVSRNFDEDQVKACGTLRAGECLCGVCMRQGETLLTERSLGDARHTKAYPGMADHGHVILPLRARGGMLGVLSFYLPAGTRLPEKEVKLYESIADILSVSIQNAVSHRQVAMLAQSLDSSTDLIVITDLEGRILHVNPQAKSYLGYAPDELRGKHISLMYSPRTAILWGDIHNATLAEGGWRGEIINIRKDGYEYPVLLSTSLVKYENDQIIALIGIVRDISTQKRAEAVLRQSEERYRLLFNLLPYGGEVLDREGRIMDCSNSNARLLGFERDELIGRRITELLAPESVPIVRDKFSQLLEGAPVQAEIRMVRKDGKTIDVMRAAQPIRDADGNITGALALSVDITERKKTEEEKKSLQLQLLQSQKLESIGRLAAGVAHDFNNLLTIIQGYSELGIRKIPEDHPLRGDLSTISDAGKKAAALTRQLLAFSRRQTLSLKPVKLNDLIETVSKMLERMIGEDIVLERRLLSQRHVLADAAQIEQILMNLAVNARDAMPRGGRMVIETADAVVAEDGARSREGGAAGAPGHSDRDRHRHGHEQRGAGADLRTVLHHQGDRQRHRSRACHGLRHRDAAQRPHPGIQRDRQGNDLHDQPARCGRDGSGGRGAGTGPGGQGLRDGSHRGR